MKKIDLNYTLKGVDGVSLPGKDEESHAGVILANALAQNSTDDPIKFFNWGLILYKKEPLILDKSDCDKLEKFVKEKWSTWNLVKAQVLESIHDSKSE